jgi:hypothetical protein
MAIKQVARGKSLAFSQVGSGGPAGPIAVIQNWSFSRSQELAAFLGGLSRVDSHYAGKKDASITIETPDIAQWSAFEVGQKYDSVVLTVEGSVDSAGTANGDDITITLSAAVVSEVGEISAGNENSSPAVASVTFQLSKHPEDTEDPTWAIAEVGGG